jgi:ABC-type transport system involved in multi-copper enzyme maturation permease subunit
MFIRIEKTTHSHWRSLMVKEWHVHKRKLVALTAILLVVHACILMAATFYGDFAIGNPLSAFNLLALTLFLCTAPGALFVGMGVAAGERSAGTLAFMHALPVPPWKVAAAKLLMASVAVVAPIAVTVLVDEWWLVLASLTGGLANTRVSALGVSRPFATIGLAGLVASGVAVSILFWSAVAGARQLSELRAGIEAVGGSETRRSSAILSVPHCGTYWHSVSPCA